MTPTAPTRARLLVVDDDEENITFLLRAALQHFGFEVEVAGDGRTALSTVHAGAPDLIVLDVMRRTWTGSRCAGACVARASTRRCSSSLRATARSRPLGPVAGW